MPTTTYTPIASVTLSASASEVVFSGLPQTYRDLILVARGQNSGSGYIAWRANADTGTNYSWVQMGGGDTGVVSGGNTHPMAYFIDNQPDSNTAFSFLIQVMDYSASDKQKTALARANATRNSTGYVRAGAQRWANTSAITSFTIVNDGSTFASGSTFNLFGVIA